MNLIDTTSGEESANAPFPMGGGELAELIRAFDWSETSIGAIASWPQSLKTVTDMLLRSPLPIVLLWGPEGIMIYNDAYSVFSGGRHPQLLGSKVREGWPEVADFNDNVMKVGLAGETLSYKDQELTLYRRGRGEQVWMNLDYSPVIDESGQPAGVIAFVVETTERMAAQNELRASEERFRALVTAASNVVYRMSADGKEMRLLDGRGLLSDMDMPRVAWQAEYLFPEDRAAVAREIDEAIRNKRMLEIEHRVRRADGSVGWTFSRAIPLFDAAGEITEWFGAASDVTERHSAEHRLRLVVNELNHRVKNNLAMIQAIASQTFRHAESVTQAQADFTSRIMALAQANDLLTGERGVGASLRGVVEQAMRPHFKDDPTRCDIDGPDVKLSPKTALSLSIAMHELTTNALKYGAWSVPTGKVAITWNRQSTAKGERLRMEWRESGGPPVKPPQKRGFGSRLIERGLAAEMAGEVKMHFEPDGLVCAVDAPVTFGEDA